METGHLDNYVDVHKGELIFVLGNSSSLNELDLSLLTEFTTIGVQRILETYEPSYVFIVDNKVIEDQYEYMNAVSGRIPLILFPWKMGSKMRALYPGPWISSGNIHPSGNPESKTGTLAMPPCGGSGYEAACIAYRMGAKTIAMAGEDLHWPRRKDTHSFGSGKARACKLGNSKQKVEYFRKLKQIYKRRGVGLVSVSPWQTPLRDALGYTPLPDLIDQWQSQQLIQSGAK